MFFGKLINILKKESPGQILPKARVVQLYETKEGRIKYFGIKIDEKFGSDKDGQPISSSNYKYVNNLVWIYNRRLNG